MSLVELLVVVAVLALFLITTDRVLLATSQASRLTRRAVDMQQNARVAGMRLRREVRESGSGAVRCHPDATCGASSVQITFPSARPSDAASVFCLDVAAADPSRAALSAACGGLPLAGTYTPVWRRHIGYHLGADGELRRLVQALPIVLPMPAGSGQTVATHIAAFHLSSAGRLLRIRVESLAAEIDEMGGTPAQRMILEDTVQLRNAVPRPAG